MATIIPSGFSLQAIRNSSVLDATVSTLKDTFNKLSHGLTVASSQNDSAVKEESPISLTQLADAFSVHQQNLTRATVNANDAVSMVQLADAGLKEIQVELEQLHALAMVAANSEENDQGRQIWQTQAQESQGRVDHTVQNTLYNEVSLLATHKTIPLQTGLDSNEETILSLKDFSDAFTPVDLSSRAGAEAALSFLQEDREKVDVSRIQWANVHASLRESLQTLETTSEHLTGSGMRIQNADMAQEMSRNIAATIRAFPGLALDTQANHSAAKVQKLL